MNFQLQSSLEHQEKHCCHEMLGVRYKFFLSPLLYSTLTLYCWHCLALLDVNCNQYPHLILCFHTVGFPFNINIVYNRYYKIRSNRSLDCAQGSLECSFIASLLSSILAARGCWSKYELLEVCFNLRVFESRSLTILNLILVLYLFL